MYYNPDPIPIIKAPILVFGGDALRVPCFLKKLCPESWSLNSTPFVFYRRDEAHTTAEVAGPGICGLPALQPQGSEVLSVFRVKG